MNDASSDRRTGWLRRLRPICLVLIGVFYGLSVPWYREPGETPALWLGLPDWVAVAVLCYVAVAVLNSLAWLGTDFQDPPPEAPAETEG